jgi:hypothetical protein
MSVPSGDLAPFCEQWARGECGGCSRRHYYIHSDCGSGQVAVKTEGQKYANLGNDEINVIEEDFNQNVDRDLKEQPEIAKQLIGRAPGHKNQRTIEESNREIEKLNKEVNDKNVEIDRLRDEVKEYEKVDGLRKELDAVLQEKFVYLQEENEKLRLELKEQNVSGNGSHQEALRSVKEAMEEELARSVQEQGRLLAQVHQLLHREEDRLPSAPPCGPASPRRQEGRGHRLDSLALEPRRPRGRERYTPGERNRSESTTDSQRSLAYTSISRHRGGDSDGRAKRQRFDYA